MANDKQAKSGNSAPATLPPPVSPAAPTSEVVSQIIMLPLDSIHIDWKNNNSRQFLTEEHRRKWVDAWFESEKGKTFLRTIRLEGIMNPLTVLPPNKESGGKHVLKVGFMRSEAARRLEMKTVPVVQKTTDDQTADRLNFIENAQRADLTTFQVATALTNFYRKYKMTSEEAGKQHGLSASYARALVAARENLAPEIMEAWATRDKDMDSARYVATQMDKLLKICGMPQEEQLYHFHVSVLVAEGKPEDEAKKLASEKGYRLPAPVGPSPKGKAKSIKVEFVKRIQSALKDEFEDKEIEKQRVAINSVLEYLLSGGVTRSGNPKALKVGETVLWDPRQAG